MLQLALAVNHVGVIRAIVMSDLPYSISCGTFVPAHRGSWFQLLDPKSGLSNENRVSLVSEVINVFSKCSEPNVHKMICSLQDSNGRTAYMITNDEIRMLFHRYVYFCGRYSIGALIHQSATSIVVHAQDFEMLSEYKIWFQSYATPKDKNVRPAMDAESSLLNFGAREKHSVEMSLSLEEFTSCVRAIGAHLDVDDKVFEKLVEADFKSWDVDHNSTMTEEEFIAYCKAEIGESRKVVMKFMKNQVSMRGKNDFYFHELIFFCNILPFIYTLTRLHANQLTHPLTHLHSYLQTYSSTYPSTHLQYLFAH